MIIYDPECTGEEWVFKHTDLSMDLMRSAGLNRGLADWGLHILNRECRALYGQGIKATGYNSDGFDRILMARDLPILYSHLDWAPDIMPAAAQVSEIPRRHEGTYPRLEDAYNHLCPDDPAGIHGKERHRAASDARVAAEVLRELHMRGLYRW